MELYEVLSIPGNKCELKCRNIYVRFPEFETYHVPAGVMIISPQFTVAELHAFEEAVTSAFENGESEEQFDYKIRNIFNARKMNERTQSYSTYVSNTHRC